MGYKIKMKDGSIYTTDCYGEDDIFLKFVDIKGTNRWINKTEIVELRETKNGEYKQ